MDEAVFEEAPIFKFHWEPTGGEDVPDWLTVQIAAELSALFIMLEDGLDIGSLAKVFTSLDNIKVMEETCPEAMGPACTILDTDESSRYPRAKRDDLARRASNIAR